MKEFESFAGMAAHLIALSTMEKVLEHEVLEHACVLIEGRSKDKLGEYQDQAGPFSAWPALAESTRQDRISQGYSEDEPGLRSGEMRDSIEHKVEGSKGHVGSNDDNLLWFEMGTVKQPARSVLGGAAFELEPKIQAEIGLAFTSFLSGGGKRIPVR